LCTRRAAGRHGCVEMGLAVVSVQADEEIGRAERLEVDLRQKHLRVQGSEAVNDSGGARAGPQEGTAGKSHRVQSSSGARSEQVSVRFQCCEGRAHTVHVMEGPAAHSAKKAEGLRLFEYQGFVYRVRCESNKRGKWAVEMRNARLFMCTSSIYVYLEYPLCIPHLH
jgi:hypothetical protein